MLSIPNSVTPFSEESAFIPLLSRLVPESATACRILLYVSQKPKFCNIFQRFSYVEFVARDMLQMENVKECSSCFFDMRNSGIVAEALHSFRKGVLGALTVKLLPWHMSSG